jgi:hypothetical protein
MHKMLLGQYVGLIWDGNVGEMARFLVNNMAANGRFASIHRESKRP